MFSGLKQTDLSANLPAVYYCIYRDKGQLCLCRGFISEEDAFSGFTSWLDAGLFSSADGYMILN